MTKDRITQLIQSSNIDDVELAIHFLGSYRIADIKKMLPGGSINIRRQTYEMKLMTHFRHFKHIRLSNCLFISCYGYYINFHAKPSKNYIYKPLYD